MVYCSLSCVLGCFAGKWLYYDSGFSSFSGFGYGSSIIVYSVVFLVSIFLFLLLEKLPFFRKYKQSYDKLLFFLLPFLFLLSIVRFYGHAVPSALEIAAEQEMVGTLTGTIYKIIETEKGRRIYLKNATFYSGEQEEQKVFPKEREMLQHNLLKMQKERGRVLLYDSSEIQIKVGNIIAAKKIKLQSFQKASNHGQYDEYQYQKSHNMDAMAYLETFVIIDNKFNKLSSSLQSLKKRLKTVYDDILEEKEASIIKAMVLGEKSGLDSNIKKLYSKNGIAHILAISGLHISMLGLIFYNIIRGLILKIESRMQNSRRMEWFVVICPAVCAILFVICYGEMTGFSVSASRAVIMFFLVLSAGIVGRTYDLFTSASLAALLILIKEPLFISDSGFWLSFGAILGIAVLFPVLEQIYLDIEKIRQKVLKPTVLEQIVFYIKKKIKNGLIISTAVFLMTMPIVIKTYFSYPLYGIILNLIIVPFMSILFPIAFFMGMLGLFWRKPASVLAVLVKGILDFYETVCLFVQKLPGAVQITGCPSTWKLLLYYAVIAGFLFIWEKRKKEKIRKNAEVRKTFEKEYLWKWQLGIPFLCLILFLVMYRWPSRNFKLHFLDIGQGDSIVMELPKGGAITVDGGSSDVSGAGEYRLLPFLKAEGITEIECAFLTHMDKDHTSAIEELLEMEPENRKKRWIKNLAVPAVLKENEIWHGIKKLAQKRGTTILYIHEGDEFEIKHIKFQCLHPMDTITEAGNAASLVLKVCYGKFCMLLTGDVEKEGEAIFAENYKEELKKITILKVAHHGSKTSTSEKFIEACQPALSIISCGKNNRYGHPNQEILERLESIGSKIMVTKDCGEITLSTDGKEIKIKQFKQGLQYFLQCDTIYQYEKLRLD